MRRLLIYFTILSTYWTCFAQVPPAQQKDPKKRVETTRPSYELFGKAQLLTHFIDKGLSMSDNKPAMNASFLVGLGSQFSFGMWGSNIANVNQSDDNFWFKLLGEIRIDIKSKVVGKVYFTDNQFYTSKQRNGQTFGLDGEYGKFYGRLEWMSNLEGSKTNAEYIRLGRIFNYKKGFKYVLSAGYTNSRTRSIISYFDFNVEGRYFLNSYSTIDGGVTFTSNLNQLNGRGAPAIYFGITLQH